MNPELLRMLLMAQAGQVPGVGAGAGAAQQGMPPLMPTEGAMMNRIGPAPQPGFMSKLMSGPGPLTAALDLGISALTGQLEDNPAQAVGGAVGAGGGAMGGAKIGGAVGGPPGALIGGGIGALAGKFGGSALGKALGGESKSEKKRKKIEEEIEQKRALQMMLSNLSQTANYLNRSNQRRSRRF